MNDKIKNYLGVSAIIAIFILAFSVVAYVKFFAKTADLYSLRSFSTSGEGRVVAVPDTAEFTFSVITQGGKDITKLTEENTAKTNKIMEFLKASGVKDEDVKTQNYNVEPRYQYFSCPPVVSIERSVCPLPEISGYTVIQTVLAKVRDFTKTGDTLSGVVKNGANNVSQLNFTIYDSSELQNKAREQAIQKAKEKAKKVAKAGGFRIGKLISIEEGGYIPPPIFYGKGIGGGFEGGEALNAVPVIQPGSQEITVNVTLRYEIK